MPIDHQTLLFFDASWLIAAAGSPTGGSGFLLARCARHLLRGAPFGYLVATHDRAFLRATADEIVEVSRVYPGGVFRTGVDRGARTPDPWDIFPTLEKKEHEASDHAAIYADLTDF